jgi:hypothetical protein
MLIDDLLHPSPSVYLTFLSNFFAQLLCSASFRDTYEHDKKPGSLPKTPIWSRYAPERKKKIRLIFNNLIRIGEKKSTQQPTDVANDPTIPHKYPLFLIVHNKNGGNSCQAVKFWICL